MAAGTVTQVIGTVVDVEFPPEQMPAIYNALEAQLGGERLVLEVEQHVGNNRVRCLALGATDGLARGVEAVDTGQPIAVPVGEPTLGRLFNSLGESIDGLEAVESEESWPIHRAPPKFDDQATSVEVLETGVKVMDLITQGKPFSRDQLEYIHSSKTGALIEASIYCASLLSTASAEKRRQLRAYGARVGLSFQVADDLLDVEGSQEQLGKASNKDAQTLKATYPSLLGVEKARQIKQELTKSAVEAISFLEQRGQVLEAIALFIANRDS